MEVTGKISRILPLITGEGKNGPWKKQEFVIEISDTQYPKEICFSLWGDKADQIELIENETVKVFFDIQSREYNNRYFTECRAWRVDKPDTVANPSVNNNEKKSKAPTNPASEKVSFDKNDDTAEFDDDLPF